MTIITKVGASYADHMNDDAPEVDNFSHGCYQVLSSAHFLGESLGTSLCNLVPRRAWERG